MDDIELENSTKPYIKKLLKTLQTESIAIVVSSPLSDYTTEIPSSLLEYGWTLENQDPSFSSEVHVPSIAFSNPYTHHLKEFAKRSLTPSAPGAESFSPGYRTGYSVPFSSVTSNITEIEYVQDRLLVDEISIDPIIRRRSVIIVDAIHQRTKWTDILLGLLKSVLVYRNNPNTDKDRKRQLGITESTPLKLVLCLSPAYPQLVSQLQDFFKDFSDTGSENIQPIYAYTESYYNPAIDTFYLSKQSSDFIASALDTLFYLFDEINSRNVDLDADILVFLPGKQHIEEFLKHAKSEYTGRYTSSKVLNDVGFQSLYEEDSLGDTNLNLEEDISLIRVIACSSLAENYHLLLSSGRVCAVIDSGYDMMITPSNSLLAMKMYPISKGKAEIRRLMACKFASPNFKAKCFRLYTKAWVNSMPNTETPELFSLFSITDDTIDTPLSDILLSLLSMRVKNIVSNFDFLPPVTQGAKAIENSYLYLFYMGCITTTFELTPIGKIVAALKGVPIPLARSLAASISNENGSRICFDQLLSVAAMILAGGVLSVFNEPLAKSSQDRARTEHARFKAVQGDLITLLNIYQAFTENQSENWTRNRFLNYKALIKAQRIRVQLLLMINNVDDISNYRPSVKFPAVIVEKLLQCFAKGYFLNAAKRTVSSETISEGGSLFHKDSGVRYQLLNNDDYEVRAHSKSVGSDEAISKNSSPWVIYTNITQYADNKWFIEGVSTVERKWLTETKFYQEANLS